MAEDACQRLGKEVMAFLFNELTDLLRSPFKPLHDLGEKGEVAGVV